MTEVTELKTDFKFTQAKIPFKEYKYYTLLLLALIFVGGFVALHNISLLDNNNKLLYSQLTTCKKHTQDVIDMDNIMLQGMQKDIIKYKIYGGMFYNTVTYERLMSQKDANFKALTIDWINKYYSLARALKKPEINQKLIKIHYCVQQFGKLDKNQAKQCSNEQKAINDIVYKMMEKDYNGYFRPAQ